MTRLEETVAFLSMAARQLRTLAVRITIRPIEQAVRFLWREREQNSR